MLFIFVPFLMTERELKIIKRFMLKILNRRILSSYEKIK
jgi:hypothetical protein